MSQSKINGSNIFPVMMIALIISATGVKNEFIQNSQISQNTNSRINEEITSNSESLQQHIATIINGMQWSSVLDQRQEYPQLPASCADALRLGKSGNGIYKLYLPDSGFEPFDVYCLKDRSNGPAWTIIQRRQDNSVDFYRGWSEYQTGFGNLNTNYFIGLDILHEITKSQPHELWIQLEDFVNETRYAKYNSFAIGDEYDLYNLHTLGQFVGTAGDSLSYHKGSNFTTKDYDNDDYPDRNCAENLQGAWWYKYCAYSNLNGLYQNGEVTKSNSVIFWKHWRGGQYSLKYVHMAIRHRK